MLGSGSQITFHQKVNIDPLGSHCSLCGRKTNASLWFPVDWDDTLKLEQDSEQFKGWYPIGTECAKKLDSKFLKGTK